MSQSGVHEHANPATDDSHGEGSEVVHLAHGDHVADPGGHGADDGHGHGAPSEPLGPVDTGSWAAAIGGSVLAIIVVVALYLAISAP